MSAGVGHQQARRDGRSDELVIDGVVSTQPELGPSIPDGGYGWVVFLATLFFQALIPSMIVSFGMFLAFSRLTKITSEDVNPKLWDNKLMHVPLFFIATWTAVDPTARALIANSTWPRLVATAGTCLTCAGLLFLWMGMTGYGETSLYILAGLVSGIGASIQISQCEILLAQYFRLKHSVLAHITQAVTAVGFILAPITIGHHVLSSSLLNVILWYQAVILQGLIFNLTFKKPLYLKKSRQQARYNYISSNGEDEEDIFSKNTRELQIKRQNSTGTNVTIEKHAIPSKATTNHLEAGPSRDATENDADTGTNDLKKNWEAFEDDEEGGDEKNGKYDSLKEDWETFDEEEEIGGVKPAKKKNWEKFEDDEESQSNTKPKNLQLELSFAEESSKKSNSGPTTGIAGLPLPLFSDLPVNNNNTYSYDVLEQLPDSLHRPAVFMPTTIQRSSINSSIDVLKQPTFYKSLLMVITTKFSIFVYFTLFPTYLYQELERIKMRNVSTLVGVLSISSLLFSGMSYWVNIDKKRRPICLWVLCWMGSFGYFMVSDSNTEYVLLLGAVQITLSIVTLQYVGMPLLGLTLRGETSKEFGLISLMSGFSFLFFLIINASFRDCFRLMSLLHFFVGGVWFANFCYKRLEK